MKVFFFTLCVLLSSVVTQAQVTYLATYEGDGTDDNRFRAHSNIPGTECKSLRANETQVDGIAFCIGPTLPGRAGVREIDLAAPLTAQQNTFLANVLGRPITETTVGEVLSAIVDANGVSLKRGDDGKQRIVIKGREIWSRPAPLASYIPDLWDAVKRVFVAPAAWAAATLSEAWPGADDSTSPLTGTYNWTLYQGIVMAKVSNTIRTINSVSTQIAYGDGTLDSTNMEVRATLTTIDRGTATTIEGGVGARHNGNSTATYVYCLLRDGASDVLDYGNVVAGALTSIGTVAATAANGDIVAVRAVGDQLSCKHNGTTVLGPTTDNTGSGNVRIAIRMDGAGTATTTTVIMDDIVAELATNSRRAISPMVFK